MTELGKYGPEFQILTAVTALQAANNLKGSLDYAISRWGTVHPANEMHMMFPEELLIAGDVDALLRKLSIKMTGRALRPRSFQLIRDLLLNLPASGQDWQQNRVDAAVYMIGSIAEFNIMK